MAFINYIVEDILYIKLYFKQNGKIALSYL
jgi:hypothetical protein